MRVIYYNLQVKLGIARFVNNLRWRSEKYRSQWIGGYVAGALQCNTVRSDGG